MKKTKFLLYVFMAIVMMALSPMKSWAEDVTIGNGSLSNWAWPYCTWYKAGSSVMYYTSAEMRGGSITSIAFRVASGNQLTTNFVKVYMADTDINSLTSALDVTSISFTQVYEGSPTLGTASGWEPLELSTPFNHNKSKNLLVAVCRSSANANNGNLNYYFHDTGTSNNVSLYHYGGDESDADITNSTNSYTTYGNSRPDTRFTFAPCTNHVATHHARVESDCATNGTVEYWQCDVCDKYFSDENCTNELDDINLPLSTTHASTTYHAAVAPGCTTNGTVENWQCNVCGKYFSDENCTSELASIVASKLGHNLDAENRCSRCGETIIQLDGTPFDLDNYNYTGYPIYVYSDHFVSGPVNQSYTGNLIFTGNGTKQIIIYDMPADGKLALRDATINVGSSAINFANNTKDLELVIEGNVSIYGGCGALYASVSSPNVTVNGPGNLSISSNSGNATIYNQFQKMDIDILGDFTLEGSAFVNSNYEMSINANSITANGTGTQPFIRNARNASLHAKGDILLESITTAYDLDISNDKIWCIKSIESDEGTVLLRMSKGGIHESVGVKAGYAGIPAVSTGNTNFSAFTWKIVDKTTGAATYYGCDPKHFSNAYTTAYDVYINLVKDSEGNTVFDMANLNNGPIYLYDGHFSNNDFKNICWEGHPVFTGTDNGSKMLIFSEPLSAANTPILRDLTISTYGPCLSGSNVAAIIDGNVSLSSQSSAISTSSCTITGDGSLTLRGTGYIYSCSDLNIDITGDLAGSNSSGFSLQQHDFDFSKLHANSITFRANTGSVNEHAIIMPTPDTAPLTYNQTTTYPVKLVDKAGSTIWYINYDRAMVYVDLDGTVTVVDENQFGTEAALSLSDDADFDKSGYSSKTFYVPSVRYERTLGTSNWGTIMMPFEMHSNSDVQYYTVTDVNLSAGTMTVAPVDVVYPGHPCLFKRLTSGNLNLNSGSKTLVCTSTFGLEVNDDWTLTGEYNALTLDATTSSNDYYYISNDQFWHATGTVNVKPYRAYFIGEAPTSSVKSLTIMTDDGEETRIEAVMDSEGNIHDASSIYDMQGRKLNSLQKGINIVNGKKVVVK